MHSVGTNERGQVSAREGDSANPNGRIKMWRVVGITLGIAGVCTILLGAVWFWRLSAIVGVLPDEGVQDLEKQARLIKSLGGPKSAAPQVVFYFKAPRLFAPHKAAAEKLLMSCGRYGAPFFVSRLQSSDEEVRAGAALSLGCIGGTEDPGEEAVAALERGLEDSSWRVRLASVDAFGNIGPRAQHAVPALIRAVSDRVPVVRWHSVQTLSEIDPGNAEVVKRFRNALDDEEDMVRLSGVYGLQRAKQASEDTIRCFIRMLSDKNRNVRLASAEALGRLGPQAKEALPYLVERLNDPDSVVRDRVSDAIRKIKGIVHSGAGVRS